MRLFVALDLPEAVRGGLAATIAELAPIAPRASGVRWVRPEALHVTLKFIGHIADERLPDFRAALSPVRSGAPIELHYRGVGFFPNTRRPRVLWCGVKAASPNLAGLAAEIESALEPLGVARESHTFVPHLTLARLDPSANIRDLMRAAEGIEDQDFGAARETEFHLYESMLKTSGAEYRKLESYSFVKEARET
jgi:RNA 2',3'-cyclic 3'-phosphodiesterase